MNALQRLVRDELKAQGIKRSELVKQMGFCNINKGLRRLDELMAMLEGHENLLPLLQNALKLRGDKLQTAVNEMQDQLVAETRAVFRPIIQVIPATRPTPVFVAAMVPSLLNIQVPEGLASLPVDKELSVVCDLYRKHRKKHEGWPKGKGAIYHRNYDESFELDKDGCLTKHNRHHIGLSQANIWIGGVAVQWHFEPNKDKVLENSHFDFV